ncbi:MAG: hypothetical protein WB471_08775 [Nocardioides sp.]
MAPAVVYLHIGSPKTGTTYLQGTLWANQDALADDGVLLGRSRAANNQAIGDLLKWKPAHADLPRTWQRLCAHAAAWDGPSLVLSQEHLHKTTEEQFQALVDSFPGARFEVVLTARDLARSVPAQWQSSVRQRYTWTLGAYADAIAATPPDQSPGKGPAHHFWRRQDSAAILRRFVERLSVEQVRVVTVPASGGDPDELWRRFSQACNLGSSTQPGPVSHESLGAASAEVMRRLNAMSVVAGLPLADYKRTVNHALSRHTLASRRGEEPGLVLPERHVAWAEREAERMIDGVSATGVEVVGDLADLRPRPSSKPYVDPDLLPTEELLEAALAGLAGMTQRHAEARAQHKKSTVDEAEPASRSAAGGADRAGEPAPGQMADERPVGLGRVLRRSPRR